MSFYNMYKNRKDWRKPYRGAKSIAASCRNHGSCDYCLGNRIHKHKKREQIALEKLENYLKGENLNDSCN